MTETPKERVDRTYQTVFEANDAFKAARDDAKAYKTNVRNARETLRLAKRELKEALSSLGVEGIEPLQGRPSKKEATTAAEPKPPAGKRGRQQTPRKTNKKVAAAAA